MRLCLPLKQLVKSAICQAGLWAGVLLCCSLGPSNARISCLEAGFRGGQGALIDITSANTGTMVKVVTDKNAGIGLMIVSLVFLGMNLLYYNLSRGCLRTVWCHTLLAALRILADVAIAAHRQHKSSSSKSNLC